MKSYRALAWKELYAQKVTSILILAAVILSTMMTTAVGQSIGILSAMRINQAAGLNGNRYATLHQLTEAQADEICKDPRFSYGEKYTSAGVSDIPGSKISILLREFLGNSASAYKNDTTLEQGTLPLEPGEIALSSDILSLLGLEEKIGNTITLNIRASLLQDTELPYETSYNFTLTGILKPNYIGYVSGSATGIIGPGTAKLLLPEKYQLYSVDIRTKDKKAFQQIIDDTAQKYDIPEGHIQYNETLLSAAGISYRSKNQEQQSSGFSYLMMAGIVTGTLILFAAGLVIYNILKIAVSKRVKEYGTLRAIGAEQGKLYTLVSLNLLILCSVGIPAGAILGLLSAKGITTAAAGFFNPRFFMAGSQQELNQMIAANAQSKALPLLISAAVTLLFAFAAAMPAARFAAKVSPTAAMAGQAQPVKRRNRNTGRIRNFEAFYARMNMKRNPRRTVITVLSLVMSITVFVALQSFSSILDTSANIRQMHRGDYSLTNQADGFSPEQVADFSHTPGIQTVSTLKYSLYQPDMSGSLADIRTNISLNPGETLHLAGIDGNWLNSLTSDLSQEDIASLKSGDACLIKNPVAVSYGDKKLPATDLSAGETITINDKSLKVAGLLDNPILLDNDGFVNGVQVIVFDTVYDTLTGHTGYSEIYPVLSPDADRKAVENAMDELCSKSSGTWFSYENTDLQLKESYSQIRLLAWGLILFVGLIGLLNIINTVYTNIHTRITEIGIQRAIGMSVPDLYKTFLWEGAYYGIIAAAVGCAAGYICTLFINAAVTDSIQLILPPWLPMLDASLISIMACLLATCIPLRQIARLSIVESIETIE